MKNFERYIERIFPIMGDCALYKIRMGGGLRIGAGCSGRCKECRQASREWLLAEAEE